MSIWNINIATADKINLVGYISLFTGAISGLTAYVHPPLANGGTISSVAFTVIGVFLTFWASGARDRHSDQMIASANENAAKANETAARFNLEAQRMKQKLAWREITPDQEKFITDILNGNGQKIFVTTVKYDVEAINFFEQVVELCKKCNFDVQIYTGYECAAGLVLSNIGLQVEDDIISVFQTANVPLIRMPKEWQDKMISNVIPEISVGSRPPLQ